MLNNGQKMPYCITPSILKAFVNAIRDILRKLRNMLSSGNVAEEHEHVLWDLIGTYSEAEKLWLAAYRQAARNKAAVGLVEWDETARSEYSIAPSLSSDLDSVLNNTFPKGTSEVYIGETSRFMTDTIQAQKLKLLMPAKKAYAAMVTEDEAKAAKRHDGNLNYHGLGKEKLLKVLEAAENPIVAIVSDVDEDGNSRHDRIMLVTDEKDSAGNNIVVIEQVNSKGLLNKRRIDANRTITAYGKEYIAGAINAAIPEGKVLFSDKKRISTVARSEEVQSLNSKSSAYFNDSINNFWANVNFEKGKTQANNQAAPNDIMARAFANAKPLKG